MNINDFYQTNLERAKRWHHGNIDEWSPLEWAAAMAGEAGECNFCHQWDAPENLRISAITAHHPQCRRDHDLTSSREGR